VLCTAVNATALIQLATVMDSPFFRTLSTIVLFIMLIFWFGNAIMTLRGIISGTIFGLTGRWTEPHQPLLPEKRTPQEPSHQSEGSNRGNPNGHP
jgi:hypothetical protein